MKQYLTPEQTTKLIESGFDTPKNFFESLAFADKSRCSYSIGELIEMLPLNRIEFDSKVFVDTSIGCFVAEELIDALYELIVKLKTEGAI